MIVVNTETVPRFEIVEMKGLVQGNTVRAKHAGPGRVPHARGALSNWSRLSRSSSLP